MKSLLPLALAFPLAIVPVVTADNVPVGTWVRIVSDYFQSPGLVVSVQPPHSPGIPSGSPLVMAVPGDLSFTDLTVFILPNGLNGGSNIRTVHSTGSDNVPSCITSHGAQSDPNRIATVENCNASDPLQTWGINSSNPTMVSQNGLCLTIPGDVPKVGDQLTIVPCDAQTVTGQLWNVIVAK